MCHVARMIVDSGLMFITLSGLVSQIGHLILLNLALFMFICVGHGK